MKKLFLLLAINLMVVTLFGKDFSKLSTIKMKTRSDYQKEESQALSCANFILDNPIKNNDIQRLYASRFILRWMSGTPDYTFTFGKEISKIAKPKNLDLMSIYVASMVKIALNNPEVKLPIDEMVKKAMKSFAKYCAKPENHVKLNRSLKKLIKEYE